MNITFANKKIEKCAKDDKLAQKEFGNIRFKIFRKRISALYAANNLEELRNHPGRWHELTGDRKGQWACDLDQPYRLVFTPQARPIPEDDHQQYVWVKIEAIEILEITNYHKEG